jgi:predicted NBD/HSP70 family sugar kinase
LALSASNKFLSEVVERWYRGLARGLIDYCYLLNPYNIVLGGGIVESKYFNLTTLKE